MGDGADPDTTAEHHRHTAGVRRINMLWETTQAVIALGVTLVALYANLQGIDSGGLDNAFFLVIGFYFGRTNHVRPSALSRHDRP